jgi:DNA primase
MSCCWSEPQQALLLNRGGGRIILMLDTDPAGWRASRQIADQLRYRCSVEHRSAAGRNAARPVVE